MASIEVFDILIYILMLSLCIITLPGKQLIKQNEIITFIIIISTIIVIAFTPIDYYKATDKRAYVKLFQRDAHYYRDIGLVYWIKLFKIISDNVWFWFCINASIYVLGTYNFLRKSFNSYTLYPFLLTILSIGFFNYGINTIRGGVAIALILAALSKGLKIKYIIPLFTFAVLMHKSVIFIVLVFFIAKYVKNTYYYLLAWIVFLILQISGIFELNIFKLLFAFVGIDDYYLAYLSETSHTYKTGLRLDFILYSFLPIFMIYWYKYVNKFDDTYYSFISNIYIGVNAIWLMFVRIPFTDRVAYLSWCLIPFVLLYPLINSNKSLSFYRKFLVISLTMCFSTISIVLDYL